MAGCSWARSAATCSYLRRTDRARARNWSRRRAADTRTDRASHLHRRPSALIRVGDRLRPGPDGAGQPDRLLPPRPCHADAAVQRHAAGRRRHLDRQHRRRRGRAERQGPQRAGHRRRGRRGPADRGRPPRGLLALSPDHRRPAHRLLLQERRVQLQGLVPRPAHRLQAGAGVVPAAGPRRLPRRLHGARLPQPARRAPRLRAPALPAVARARRGRRRRHAARAVRRPRRPPAPPNAARSGSSRRAGYERHAVTSCRCSSTESTSR